MKIILEHLQVEHVIAFLFNASKYIYSIYKKVLIVYIIYLLSLGNSYNTKVTQKSLLLRVINLGRNINIDIFTVQQIIRISA